jgi:hypothetical protein
VVCSEEEKKKRRKAGEEKKKSFLSLCQDGAKPYRGWGLC